MKRWILGLLLMATGIVLVGCISMVDPETGETLYGVTPKVADAIDTVAATTEAVAPAVVAGVTAINPVVGGVLGIIVGIFGSVLTLYRKWKQPLVAMGNKYDKLAIGARAAADVIEDIVKPNAELWEKARTPLKAAEKAGATMPDKV